MRRESPSARRTAASRVSDTRKTSRLASAAERQPTHPVAPGQDRSPSGNALTTTRSATAASGGASLLGRTRPMTYTGSPSSNRSFERASRAGGSPSRYSVLKLRDPDVVDGDALVEQLAPVRDARLECADPRHDSREQGARLEVGVRLPGDAQAPQLPVQRVLREGFLLDRGGLVVSGPQSSEAVQAVVLVPDIALDRVDEVRQLVVPLLQEHVDVAPRLVDVVPHLDEAVVHRDHIGAERHGEHGEEGNTDHLDGRHGLIVGAATRASQKTARATVGKES